MCSNIRYYFFYGHKSLTMKPNIDVKVVTNAELLDIFKSEKCNQYYCLWNIYTISLEGNEENNYWSFKLRNLNLNLISSLSSKTPNESENNRPTQWLVSLLYGISMFVGNLILNTF